MTLTTSAGGSTDAGGGRSAERSEVLARLSSSAAPQRRPRTRQTENICPRVRHDKVRVRGPDGRLARIRCKSWRDCEPCSEENRRRFLAALTAACNENPRLRRFVTLTLPGQWHRGDLTAGWRAIGPMWANLRRRLGRRYGRVGFVWVREEHVSGACHMHCLFDRYVPKWLLQAAWNEVGGGWIKINRRNARNAAGYLAKYMSKVGRQVRTERLPMGVRKYGSGGGVRVSINQPSDGSWHVEARGIDGSWCPLHGDSARLAVAMAMKCYQLGGYVYESDLQAWFDGVPTR